MGFVIPRPVVRRSIMLLVSVAMLALTLRSLEAGGDRRSTSKEVCGNFYKTLILRKK